MPLCYSAIPSRSLRRDGADLKGFGISQQVILQRKMVFVYTKTLLAGLLVIYPSALTTTKHFIFLTPFKLCIFV